MAILAIFFFLTEFIIIRPYCHHILTPRYRFVSLYTTFRFEFNGCAAAREKERDRIREPRKQHAQKNVGPVQEYHIFI